MLPRSGSFGETSPVASLPRNASITSLNETSSIASLSETGRRLTQLCHLANVVTFYTLAHPMKPAAIGRGKRFQE